MKYFRNLVLACVVFVFTAGSALAEGFSMTEWSARGLGLAGGMVGRADDPSALAYNAAGITQLLGTQFMVGSSVIMPYGTVDLSYKNGSSSSTDVERDYWVVPHIYATHQLNDNVWLGLGLYSRFGLGNRYQGDFTGASNMYDVGLKTVSFVPTVAYKVNEHLSLALGIEAMYMSLYEGVKVPTFTSAAAVKTGRPSYYNDMQLEASSMGFGAHLAAHLKINEQWAMGLTYKSQVIQNANGDADFGRQGPNLLPGVPQAKNTDVHGSIRLPDSLAFGVTYKPLDNLSFEVGGTYWRWSTFNSLDIYFDSGYNSINPKKWSDSWNVNASVEYKPVDWLALRLGYWHDSSPLNPDYSDFMLPTNGRDVVTIGTGFYWNNWTIDLAYAHIFIYPMSYDDTQTSGVKTALNGITGGSSQNANADMFSVSVGYKF